MTHWQVRMSDADVSTFLTVLCDYTRSHSLIVPAQRSHPAGQFRCRFILLCRAVYEEFMSWNELQFNLAQYQHLCQILHSVVPNTMAQDIHRFIKEVWTIMKKKEWDGISASSRIRNVGRIENKMFYTSATVVTPALGELGKLWEAVNFVYVYALMDGHPNPRAIYDLAYRCLCD